MVIEVARAKPMAFRSSSRGSLPGAARLMMPAEATMTPAHSSSDIDSPAKAQAPSAIISRPARDRIDLRERAEPVGIDQRRVVDAMHRQRQRQERPGGRRRQRDEQQE